ncbi:hypothetical protein QOT17_004544 [Balamuthia mandrillaris]
MHSTPFPLCLLAVLCSLCTWTAAQAPIPVAGQVHAIGDADAPLQLEAFIDFQCPDSKEAWPTMQALMQYYGPARLRFVATVFPLPYHHNAFFASQGAVVVTNLTNNAASFWKWADVLFERQNEWGDQPTQSKTPLQVIAMMSQYAQQCCAVQASSFVEQMGWVTQQNILARTAWKYAAASGIYGTPMFKVNGVLTNAASDWTFKQWLALLDPLLAPPSSL